MDIIHREFADKTGVSASMFSFNSEGQYLNCHGIGVIGVDMVFADPTVVICEECMGKRYNVEALGCTYRDKDISDILIST